MEIEELRKGKETNPVQLSRKSCCLGLSARYLPRRAMTIKKENHDR